MRRLTMGKTILAICMGVALAVAGSAGADPFPIVSNFTITPDDLAGGTAFDNGHGGEPFGYDPDMGPPADVTGAFPTGWGNGAFWSGDLPDVTQEYTSLRMSLKDIFGVGSVLLSNLDDLTYWTSNQSGNVDWQIKIYTEPDDGTSWYDERIEFNRPSSGVDGLSWNQYSMNSIGLYKFTSNIGGSQPVPFTWANVQTLYGSEEIMFIDIIAGYASGEPMMNSYLDGVQIYMTQGSQTYQANINLEPVPEPASMALLGLGLVGLAATRRKKRNAA